MTGLSNFHSRQILTIVVPAIIAFLSAYWFRKKRKLKCISNGEVHVPNDALEQYTSCEKQVICETEQVHRDTESKFSDIANGYMDYSITTMQGNDFLQKSEPEVFENSIVTSESTTILSHVNNSSETCCASLPLDAACTNTLNITEFSNSLFESVDELTSGLSNIMCETESCSEIVSNNHDKLKDDNEEPHDKSDQPIASDLPACEECTDAVVHSVELNHDSEVETCNAVQKNSPTSTGSPLSHNLDFDSEALSSVGTSSVSLNELFSTSPVDSVKEPNNFSSDSIVDEISAEDSGKGSTLNLDPSSSSLSSELSDLPKEESKKDIFRYTRRSNADVLCKQEPEHLNEVSHHLSLYDDSNFTSSLTKKSSDILSDIATINNCGSSSMNYVPLVSPSMIEPSSSNFVYEFELPQELCGRLIGRLGNHLKFIKGQTNATVYVKKHPYNLQLKLVVIEGVRDNVYEALELIRKKFPASQFPNVSLSQTNAALHLPENLAVDVILSSMVSAGHFFLQQPTHHTYPSLSNLDHCMLACYSQLEAPHLPEPIEAGVICAAPTTGGWYRAQVVFVYDDGENCDIRFVDYGGYSKVTTSSLRQIRNDFMVLPFQAVECYLANVEPIDVDVGWSNEASADFEELAQGQILQAFVIDYHEDRKPYVCLYRVQGINSTFINQELVNRGLAKWVEHQ